MVNKDEKTKTCCVIYLFDYNPKKAYKNFYERFLLTL